MFEKTLTLGDCLENKTNLLPNHLEQLTKIQNVSARLYCILIESDMQFTEQELYRLKNITKHLDDISTSAIQLKDYNNA